MEWQLGNGMLLVFGEDEWETYKEKSKFPMEFEMLLCETRTGFTNVQTTVDGDMGELHVDGVDMVFFLNRKSLVLVEQKQTFFLKQNAQQRWNELIQEIVDHAKELNPVRLFLRILDYTIVDDMKRLQQMEMSCYAVEEKILVDKQKIKNKELKSDNDPSRKVAHFRRELLMKSFYYTQLGDLVDTLGEDAYNMFEAGEKDAFAQIAKKISRLSEQTKVLREYLIQLREMYQQQLDMKQNENMQFLTAITTIFFPLSLVAAWYGMNFKYMPEIDGKYSYFILIGLCVCLVIVEVWIFYKKKYF